MIKLFTTPKDTIDISPFDHLLHGSIVRQFEEIFAEYIGAKYACSVSSATNAIFLCLKIFPNTVMTKSNVLSMSVYVPSIIPPVVLNAIIMSGHEIVFTDNVKWVGDSYVLHTYGNGIKIIDSAQKVERDQYKKEASENDLMIFSFYPTKPVKSCDGGMIVSSNKNMIETLRIASMNGMAFSTNSWERTPMFPGYKMYMNSVQAYVALKSLMTLDDRKEVLKIIRDYYNQNLGYDNTSDHLYRIKTSDNNQFIEHMKSKGVICGKHYKAAHHGILSRGYKFTGIGTNRKNNCEHTIP